MKKTISNDVLDGELDKFASLCFASEQPLPMFSSLIDKRWHNLIHDSLSNLPVHDTTLKTSELKQIKWIQAYEANYGKLHLVWFIDENGNLDLSSYQKYVDSGNVFSSYNCVGRK